MRTLSGSGSSAARLSRKTASPRRIRRGPLAAVGSLGVLALLLTGCTSTPTAPAEPAQSSATPSATADDVSGTSLTVLVTDRLAETGEFLSDFAATSGIDITVVNAGTPQQLASGVLDGSLVGDVIYGVDATFATRFAAAGALQDYVSPALDEKAAALQLTDAQAGAELTPVDVDYVCVNVDHTWFNANEVVEPKTLDDLIKPEYQGLLVVPSAAESSAGLFFLAASVAAFGETGWSVYWQDLLANGTQVGGTWAETYYDDYSGPSSTGTKPIVISYASSPASEMVTGTDGNVTTTTGVLLDTCIQQVGFAGVAAETTNQEGATQLIDYMLSPEFQATLPELASRYPATEIEIDADWSRMAPTPQNPFTLTARQLSDNRDRWVSQWQELVTEADAGAEEEASPSPSPTSSSKAKSKS